VDVSHLGELSYSAVPYLQELTEDDDRLVVNMAESILRRKANSYGNRDTSLRGWNYSKARALKILETYRQAEESERLP